MNKFSGTYHFNKKELGIIVLCSGLSILAALFIAKRNYIDGFEDALNL